MKPVYTVLIAAGVIVIVGIGAVIFAVKHFAGRFLGRASYYGVNNEANQYYAIGNYQGAIDDYGRMIAMRPNKIDGYQLRALAYFHIHSYGKGVADNTQALKILATPAGVSELGFGNLTPAQQQAKVAVAKGDLLFNRGLCYQAQGSDALAVADFTAALNVDPRVKNGHGARAYSYAALGQYASALPDAQIDVQQHPDVWHSYTMRGEILGHLGKNQEALSDLAKAIEMNPQDPRAYVERSKIQEKIKDYAGAAQTMRLAAESHPGNQKYLGVYGWYQYLAGDVSGALITDKKALSLPGNTDWLNANLGLCYAVEGDWPDASSQYTQAKAEASLKDRAAFLDDIHTALKTHPNSTALKKAEALLAS